MGNGFSSRSLSEADDESPSPRLKLDDIPESCLAVVMTYLEPVEICKLAVLNSAFRNASSADFIWEEKLPSNYKYLLMVNGENGKNTIGPGKKSIYAALCRPNSFDGGRKEVWLDTKTGGICLSISSKALNITGIDDRRHWNYIPTDESRFQTVAYLRTAWWVEVCGEEEFQFPAGTYSVFFKVHLGRCSMKQGRRKSSLERIHGWEVKPVRFELTTSRGHRFTSQYFLENHGKWVHYRVGEFSVDRPDEETRISFSMTQIDCTHTKGGLCVDSVLVCPSF